VLATQPGWTSALTGVDPATYGMVGAAWSSLVLGLGALAAAGALLVARWSQAPGSGWGRWATSPVLAAFFVFVVLVALVPLTAMTNRNLGKAGTTPLEERRGEIRSHPAPTRSAGASHDPGQTRE
jgi:hypothetical protein